MSLKNKFNDRLADLSMDEVDKLKNMEEAINEDNPKNNVKLIVVKK